MTVTLAVVAGLAPLPASAALQADSLLLARSFPTKSVAIYVGKELTADGSVLLGGFGHEPSSHWFEITPARTFPEGTTVEVGITGDARMPGRRFRVPQVTSTHRYITTNYSEFAGFPPPLTNGGLNAMHVAARDVWSPSRSELRAMTPELQTGLSYSDLSRMAMERAGSARGAIEIVGRLIDEHGYATYGGNSHLFADSEEGWVLIDYAGGAGLWAAERLGPDEVRVLYPGHIGDFPADFADSPDFMGSDNIVDFAVERGWWDPESGTALNLHEVYGQPFPSAPGQTDPHTLFRDPPLLETEIRAMAPLRLEDVMALVRDPRWSNDGAGYGQVAHLRREDHQELGTLWMSITGAVASPFVPVPLGARNVPPEYKQHRYMTSASDDRFLDAAYAPLEGTQSAFRLHKRLLYHMCTHPGEWLEPVTAALEAFEAELLASHEQLRTRAAELYEAGDTAAAGTLLTEATESNLQQAMALGERLLERVESETRTRHGITMPDVEIPEGASWKAESEPMTQRSGRTYHRCFHAGLEGYPRRHGSFAAQASALTSPGSTRSEIIPWLPGIVAGLLAGVMIGAAARRRLPGPRP